MCHLLLGKTNLLLSCDGGEDVGVEDVDHLDDHVYGVDHIVNHFVNHVRYIRCVVEQPQDAVRYCMLCAAVDDHTSIPYLCHAGISTLRCCMATP